MRVTKADLKWWLEKARTLEWTFAKTMPDTPHEYVVLGRTEGMTEEDYARAGYVIRAFGKPGKFYQYTNVYLEDPEHGVKYWFMDGDPPNLPYDATLINRAPIEQVYGRQDAPNTVSGVETIYDSIGPTYDGDWCSPSDLEENERVRELIVEHFGAHAPTVLDVGCGTGLLLDMKITAPSLYTGFDPSQAMLNQFVMKHPEVKRVYPMTARQFLDRMKPEPRSYELVIAMFGVASYLEPRDVEELARLASSQVILMNYDAEWFPDYYDERPASVEPARRAAQKLLEDGWTGRMVQIGHFDTTVLEV